MTNSSRRRAQSWPYPRHREFEEKLRRSNAKWFAERAYSVNPRMPYLLDSWENWYKNIILPEVTLYIREEYEGRSDAGKHFPLHKYIHHGLSSQAMLFNLVGPLVVWKNLAPIKLAFEAGKIDWPPEAVTPEFEVENREIFNEDTGQPTSIDLVIWGYEEVRSLFIEAKLIESNFGGCSVFQGGDCDGRNPAQNFNYCYLHHIGRLYWTLLEKYDFLSGPMGTSPICPLALYYQFFRELIFSLELGGDFVLLYDQRNSSFYSDGISDKRGLMPFLLTFVPAKIYGRVHSISMQQIIEVYKRNEDFPWLAEFEKKYGMKEFEESF